MPYAENTWISFLDLTVSLTVLLVLLWLLRKKEIFKPKIPIPQNRPAPDAEKLARKLENLQRSSDELKQIMAEQEKRLAAEVRSRQVLLDIARLLTQTLDLPSLMSLIVARLKEVTPFFFGIILQAQPDKSELTVGFSQGISEEETARILEDGFDLPWLVAKTRKPLIISDAAADPRFAPILKKYQIGSALLIPIVTADEIYGVLGVASLKKGAYGEKDLELLTAIAGNAAVAMKNARLYRELAREKERLQTLVENIPEGVFSADPEGHILSWNPAAERILGWKAKEIVGKRCADILRFHTDDEKICETNCVLSRVQREKTMLTVGGYNTYYFTAGGERVPVVVSVAPFENPDEKLLGTIHLFRDITREKELDQMKEDFLAAVTHELRSPLASIMGYSEILLNPKAGNLSAAQKDYMESIFRCSRNLHMLINNILESTRIEAGKMVYNMAPFNLDSLVENIFGIFIPAARQKDISLEKEISHHLYVNGDQERIKLVFSNLVSNAIKFTANGGRIVISALEEGDRIMVSVRDTGKGIPQKDFDQVFQKFAQAEGERGGTGLGLYIVKQVLEAHGEDISVESRIGEGTLFKFALTRFIQ